MCVAQSLLIGDLGVGVLVAARGEGIRLLDLPKESQVLAVVLG